MPSDGSPTDISWSDKALELRVEVDGRHVPRLGYLVDPANRPAAPHESAGQPLLDVVLSGSGQKFSGRRYSESVTGNEMRYLRHSERDEGAWHHLETVVADSGTGLQATVSYSVAIGTGVLRSRVRLSNTGERPVAVSSVSSFLCGGLAGPGGLLDDVEIWWAENEWLSESRWQRRMFRDALPDLGREMHRSRSRGRFGFTSEGTWSSGIFLPMGLAVNTATGYTLAWQIEHNGPWHWQVGEQTGEGPGASYLALLGPTDVEHQWRASLAPGEEFETVPVSIAVSSRGFEDAVGRLTNYRRILRRPHEDHRRLPVIFNDYMNALMGDPTTERLLPLISSATKAGAEYFCIDAGWYAELGEQWWETVGQWEPSKSRFRNGITEVLDAIRGEGMVPGLWIEPEVVGVRSAVAEDLPVEAFFCRDGQRVVENGRYQLDFSHPAARSHLDRVLDFMVGDLGIGYVKMDYNINVAPGTDTRGGPPGSGMLAHNRAYLEWLDALLDRHPSLTVETCSSGAMRTDYALLSRLQLQSTSDQQDPLRYPPIASAAPMAMAPEQAAVWAYPQAGWEEELIAFTLCSAMLGRVHLSGLLDRMTPAELALVSEGIRTYKQVRAHLATSVPFWPLGLPVWTDQWVSLGMRSPSATHVVLWRRPAEDVPDAADAADIRLAVAPPGTAATPRLLYPASPAKVAWDEETGDLLVSLPNAPSACLVSFEGPLPARDAFTPRATAPV